jgi:hypothetical protein
VRVTELGVGNNLVLDEHYFKQIKGRNYIIS